MKATGGPEGGWHMGIPLEGGSILLVEANLLTGLPVQFVTVGI